MTHHRRCNLVLLSPVLHSQPYLLPRYSRSIFPSFGLIPVISSPIRFKSFALTYTAKNNKARIYSTSTIRSLNTFGTEFSFPMLLQNRKIIFNLLLSKWSNVDSFPEVWLPWTYWRVIYVRVQIVKLAGACIDLRWFSYLRFSDSLWNGRHPLNVYSFRGFIPIILSKL